MANRGMEFEGEYDENDVETPESVAKRTVAERLQSRWNELHTKREHEAWRQQAIRDGDEDGGPDADCFDTEEDFKAYIDKKNAEIQADSMEMNLIEQQLSELGGRMMRAYESWGEDEEYMKYHECTKYGDYVD